MNIEGTGHNKHKKADRRNKDLLLSFIVWFSFNMFVAGALCLIIGEIRHNEVFGFGDKDWFFSLNRDAYNNYFYALSISWTAAALSSLFNHLLIKKAKVTASTIVLMVLLLLCLIISVACFSFQLEKVIDENIKTEKHINPPLIIVLVLSFGLSIWSFFATYNKTYNKEGET